ncbi:MAG: hypothetical protein NTY36_06695 [Deltaproteobacteria bacterium]|nr:hypothetical protein [Deltaproteobacteria bacterium]
MKSSRGTGRKKGIVVDPSTFELEAEWGPVSRWTQVFAWVLIRSRHQPALVGSLAILIALKLAGVGAADTLILSIAIISIATIAIVATILEWIGSKRHGQSGEREAAPQYAAQD